MAYKNVQKIDFIPYFKKELNKIISRKSYIRSPSLFKQNLVLLDSYYVFENKNFLFQHIQKESIKGFSIYFNLFNFQHYLNNKLKFQLTSNRIVSYSYLNKISKKFLKSIHFEALTTYKDTFLLGPIKSGYFCIKNNLSGIFLTNQFKIWVVDFWLTLNLDNKNKQVSFISLFVFINLNINFFFNKISLKIGYLKVIKFILNKKKFFGYKYIKTKQLNLKVFFFFNNLYSKNIYLIKSELYSFELFLITLFFMTKILNLYRIRIFKKYYFSYEAFFYFWFFTKIDRKNFLNYVEPKLNFILISKTKYFKSFLDKSIKLSYSKFKKNYFKFFHTDYKLWYDNYNNLV